ncbi:MAG TPA: 4Fe-4S binding protein [Candidatus Angelobacter sp.]|nr:4Fe-4S binding protein [Candidatus Angelobacter sp.]
MAYVIAEPCIGVKDAACFDVCPVDAIHPGGDEPASDQLYIDPEACISCAACVPVCPVSAIYAEEDLPQRWKRYIQINRNRFEKETPAA